jgi:hypothetical protein
MRTILYSSYISLVLIAALAAIVLSACWGGSSQPVIVVNSLEDLASPPEGTVTLRSALEEIESGGRISFAESLDGGTIDLSIVGEEHSTLSGEQFFLVVDTSVMPPNVYWRYDGFVPRDYGASALYAAKDLNIDASGLPDGITLNWTGGEDDPARVLAVYGDLTMENVNLSSGVASAVFLTSTRNVQNYTLARGAGVAVWGEGRFTGCEISNNHAFGDTSAGRDRGAFGGGIYGDVLILEDCVVAGNSVNGYGAAGGGIYSVGGDSSTGESRVVRTAVSGNRVQGQHAYGGGIYSDGGGRGNNTTITLASSTIAGNAVMNNPNISIALNTDQYYFRGGGFYMSNGSLTLSGCTVAENMVSGFATVFNGEPNMSGGGIAATVGDAHVVERMDVSHSIVTGNTVDGQPGDLFTGSLIDFYSWGYNLVGDLNFDHILVPVPWWPIPGYMSRKHYPKVGDMDGVLLSNVLSVDEVRYHPMIVSVGAGMGDSALLWYPPMGLAVDTIPAEGYWVTSVRAGFYVDTPFGEPENFLYDVLDHVNFIYGQDYSSAFGTRDLGTITFYGPSGEWPDTEKNPENIPWITFWRDLDAAIAGSPGQMGVEKLADEFWGQPFQSGNGPFIANEASEAVHPVVYDQLGNKRPVSAKGDVGAIELQF